MTFGMQRFTWTRLAILACVAGSVLGGLVHVADAAGKPGMVKAKGGYTFQGEVDEDAAPGKVIVIQANGQKVELFKQAVDSIVYFNTPREEFDARLANLGKQDIPGRLALARWAITKKEADLANEAVKSAKAIDANNREVLAMEKQVAAAMPPKPEVKPDVTTQPATQPAEKAAPAGPAIRTLTPEEVQTVRIREMKPGEKLRATVPPALRKDIVAAGLVPANQIGRLSVPDLAALVLAQGTPAMKEQVKILSDPASLTDYKMRVNKILVTGCAAANCHGSDQSKSFRLFAQTNDDASVLSNFVILQKTDRTIDNVRRLMIDRANPRSSLLLAYMLPPTISQLPHPEVPGFKPVVKTANDPGFVATADWITNSLKVILADGYGDIDLTKPPPEKKDEKQAAAAPR